MLDYYCGGLLLKLSSIFFAFSTGISADNLLSNFISYSDYTRNAMMVIDDDRPALYGRLTFEDMLWARVPRQLVPSKPKDFGTFYLAKLYYPEWFESDTGSPTFGIGVTYADFKEVTIIYLVMSYALIALLLKIFILRTKRYRHPCDFVMLLFFSGVALIPLGAGYLLPEHILMALGLSILLRLTLTSRTKDGRGDIESLHSV